MKSNPLARQWADYWKPEADEPWYKWAEREITLTKYTPNPGPYSTDLTPFCREWIECFRDPGIREATFVTGSQVSKTQSCLIGLAATIKNRPVEAIWADPTREDAKSMSETRWDDIVEHSPLRDLKPDNPDRYKKLEQQFRRCTLTWVGAGSEAKLKSRPVGLIVLNEVEAWDAPSGSTHPAEEAEQRVKTYAGSKIIRNSTPKLAAGYIWQKYLQGDQRKYFVPCPHCSEKILLEWKNVKWSSESRVEGVWDYAKVAASAYHECPNCEGHITDHHKPVMLIGGEWRPTNPGADPAFRSYHLSSLYSPWRSTGFGALAVQFIKAKDSLLGLQGFINGVLAEPWEQQQYVDPISFPGGTYEMGKIEVNEKTCAGTWDVQLDHFWGVVREHGKLMASKMHFAGRVESFDDIEAMHRKFGMTPNTWALDCAYDRNGDVYKACARNHWFALRGDSPKEGFYRHVLSDGSKMRRIYSPQEKIDAYSGIQRPKGVQISYCLRVFFAKNITDDILQALLLRVRGDWQTPTNAPREWLEQINARRKLPKHDPLTGETTYEWQEVVRKWDHLRDAECMQVIIAAMRGWLRDMEPGPVVDAKPSVQPSQGDPAKIVADAQHAAALVTPQRRTPFVPRGTRRGFARNW